MEVITELKNKHILIEDDKKYDFYYYEMVRFNTRNYNQTILPLTIAPTTACNFDCPYCFEPKIHPQTINEQTIGQIEEFVKSHKLVDSIDLTWYGGEPLLAFDKMRTIYSMLTANDMPKINSHSIITNGYLINDEIIEFFKISNLNTIQITLDGIKAHHDATRCLKKSQKPTFNIILDNIDKIISCLPKVHIDLRVNINKQNYTDFIELFHYFKQKYPTSTAINVYPGLIREETSDKCSMCHSSFKSRDLVELYSIFKENGINTALFPQKRHKGCMAHMLNAYIIGPEGEIYKCWNDVSNPDMVIGNINTIKLNGGARLIKFMTQAIPFNDVCKECQVFPLCDGGCSYLRYRNLFNNGQFDICSPYKDLNSLKRALLNGDLKTDDA